MSGPALSRAFVTDIEIRSGGDGRTIHGILVPFGVVARVNDGGPSYDEMFERGAFARTIDHQGERVKLLTHHNARQNPLGRATLLREDANGLYGEFYISATSAGDDVLELVRDGAFDSFSIGFRSIRHAIRGRVTVRTEVGLREASLVTFPAYELATVGGVRADDIDINDLAARVAAIQESRSTTPPGEGSEATGTASALAPAEPDPAMSPLRSAAQTRLAFSRALRERKVG